MTAAKRQYLTGAQLVLPDAEVDDGALLIAEGRIEAVCPERAPRGTVEHRCGGAALMPGLIDLHTDALEREAEPRPGVHLPFEFALGQMDRKSALLGITTVYHAISFAGEELGMRDDRVAAKLARAIFAAGDGRAVDHRVHCRCEVTGDEAVRIIGQLIEEGICAMVSLMDHSPGQGQYPTDSAYHEYLVKNYAFTAKKASALIRKKHGAAGQRGERMRQMAERARAASVPLASHDDDSAERVAAMADLGVTLCEFPLNLAAAEAIRARGLSALVGSPNVFRGGSQAGGARAADLVAAGCADCLCSDYAPATLLPAAFRLAEELSLPLWQAVRFATANPAKAAGLEDRGTLQAGRRADLIAVCRKGVYPAVVGCWSAGRQVLLSCRPGGECQVHV